MASVIAHELEEAATDPDLNAWYDSRGYENADKCAWTFGTEYTASNGSKDNITLGARQYLIQRNWVNAGRRLLRACRTEAGRAGPSPRAHTPAVGRIALADDTWLDFQLDWLSASEAQRCLAAVRAEVTWVERKIVLYGKRIMQPRLVGWAGEIAYRYSGQTLEPRAFTERSALSPTA